MRYNAALRMRHLLLKVPSATSWNNRRVTLPAIVGSLTALTSIILTIVLTTRFVSNIHVIKDPMYWSFVARQKVYDVCYDGCADCLDVSVITKACRTTALTIIENVSCDAAKMWWWSDTEAKYPTECLLVIGEGLRVAEEARRKFWWRALYLLVLLSVPLGCGVFLATQWVMGHMPWSYRPVDRYDEPPSSPPPYTPQAAPEGPGKAQKAYRGPRNVSTSRTPLLAAAIVALVLPPSVKAYPCITHPAYNQLFSNPSRTIHGVVHGWLSNCIDRSYSCGETCTTSPTSGQRSCHTDWCSREEPDWLPRDYVTYVVPYIQKCGFNLVDYVPVVVDRRIPNPNIEERFKVKVAVSQFNGTSGLDEGVECLYSMMVEPPKWF